MKVESEAVRAGSTDSARMTAVHLPVAKTKQLVHPNSFVAFLTTPTMAGTVYI